MPITDAARRKGWCPNDERDAEYALVDEDAVVALAVLPERLAVIPGDNDDGPIQQLAPVERLEQAANLRVGKGDLADVWIDVARVERLGRIVGSMRVVEMRPEEEA
jgi:hypothetical protein